MAKLKSKKNPIRVSPFKNYWTRTNYILLIIGITVIIVGFILMAQSPWDNTLSLSVSPIVLIIAYLIILPFSILYNKKRKTR